MFTENELRDISASGAHPAWVRAMAREVLSLRQTIETVASDPSAEAGQMTADIATDRWRD